MAISPAEKKIEFFSFSPLRIKTAFATIAAFPRKRELRSLAYAITAGGADWRARYDAR